MNRFRCNLVPFYLVAFLCMNGCLSRQVTRDGTDLRQAVLQLYTDQAMDNLINAYENKPFVQVKYEKISVNDIDTVKGTVGIDETLTQTRPRSTAAASRFTRVLKDVWSVGGDASRVRKMVFYANPVTDHDEVYEAYVHFARDPNLFRVTDQKPAKCEAHVMRKCQGRYYWVPVEAAPVYLELLLQTSFMLGEETIVGYRERTCVGLPLIKKLGEEGDSFRVEFNAPVPNGSATLVVVLGDGRKYKVRALKHPDIPESEPTSSLEIQLVPESPLRSNLIGSLVRVYSDLYPPEAAGYYTRTGPSESTGSVERSLELIRQTR